MPDRTKAPELRKLERFRLPEPSTLLLEGGVPLVYLNQCTQEVIRLDLLFAQGYYHEPRLMLSPFTLAMTRRGGTASHTEDEIASMLDFMGASIECAVYTDRTVMTVYVLTRFLDEVLPMLLEMLTEPVFSQESLEQYRSERLQAFLVSEKRTTVQAANHFRRLLFSARHPAGRQIRQKDYETVTRQMIVDYFRKNFQIPHGAALMGVYAFGCVRQRELDIIRRHLGVLRAPSKARMRALDETILSHRVLPLGQESCRIRLPGSSQMSMRMGSQMVRRDHPDYNDLRFLVAVLGGSFSSRLMRSVREQKGYTYSIGAELTTYPDASLLTIGCDFDSRFLRPLKAEILHQMDMLCQEPVPQDELEMQRVYQIGSLCRECDSAFSIADMYLFMDGCRMGRDCYDKRVGDMLSVTSQRLLDLARTYFGKENLKVVLAG